VDEALGLGVGYHHPHPLGSIVWFEGHDVAKVRPVVVLWLHRLGTDTSNMALMRHVLPKTSLEPASCELMSLHYKYQA